MVTGYLIELVKHTKGKSKETFPKLRIYDLSRKKEEFRDQKDEIGDTIVSDLFTKYLDPCLNKTDFNGERFIVPQNYAGMKMIFLPLYGECTDGKYSGHFLGWLMQIIPKDVAKKIAFDQLITKELETLLEYTSKCSELSNLLAQTLLDANVREILDQELGDRECHEFLQQEFCLLGGCKEAKVETITSINEKDFKSMFRNKYFRIDSKSKNLWIDLNSPLPEQDSEDFIKPEDVGEKSLILKLDFNNDYLHPSSEREDEHYDKIAKLACLIYRELIENKWRKMRILKHSTRAAVTSIISRNHSHHIGSHVMPRTSIEKIKDRLNVLCNNISEHEKILYIINTLRNRLDEYIQKKADFIAEISTEPLTTTKNLLFFDEIILNFLTNTLLMDNIGANENVKYKNYQDNRLKMRLFFGNKELSVKYKASGCNVEYTHNCPPYSLFCTCQICIGELEQKSLQRHYNNQKERDMIIALPGSLGEFALYAFLENFIRNGIKHNKDSLDNSNKNYEVIVKVSELDNDDKDEFYKVDIYDNFTKPDKKITTKNENGKDIDIKLHEYLQHCINKPIINNNGTLKKESWGIAEMKIMATLLRGSLDFLNMKENLKVSPITDNGKKRLAYGFYVMKPKNVAIISKEMKKEEKTNHRDKGIWWFNSTDEFKDHIIKGKSPAAFKFLIINKLGDKNNLDVIKLLSPFRVLVNKKVGTYWHGCQIIEESDMENIKNNKDGEIILDIAWKMWIGGLLKRKEIKKIDLLLFLQQNKNEEPTDSWMKKEDIRNTLASLPITLSVLAKDDISQLGKFGNKMLKQQMVLMYDRHFAGFNNAGVEKDKIFFHEAFDKNSSDFIHIFSQPTTEKVYELIEAGLLEVLIIDERIAEVAHEKLKYTDEACYAKQLYDGPERILAAQKAGIYICTYICTNNQNPQPLHLSASNNTPLICVKFHHNIHNNDSDLQRKVDVDIYKCENMNCSNCESEKKSIDVLIIHQGVLENFFKELKTQQEYNAFLEALQQKIPYIIIDSGRGIPAKLPDAAKFMPFSLLEDFLMKERLAKYCLVKNIMPLNRRKKDG